MTEPKRSKSSYQTFTIWWARMTRAPSSTRFILLLWKRRQLKKRRKRLSKLLGSSATFRKIVIRRESKTDGSRMSRTRRRSDSLLHNLKHQLPPNHRSQLQNPLSLHLNLLLTLVRRARSRSIEVRNRSRKRSDRNNKKRRRNLRVKPRRRLHLGTMLKSMSSCFQRTQFRSTAHLDLTTPMTILKLTTLRTLRRRRRWGNRRSQLVSVPHQSSSNHQPSAN